jgi:hypothetical protein
MVVVGEHDSAVVLQVTTTGATVNATALALLAESNTLPTGNVTAGVAAPVGVTSTV